MRGLMLVLCAMNAFQAGLNIGKHRPIELIVLNIAAAVICGVAAYGGK